MTTTLTALSSRLAEIKARCDAATPGKWTHEIIASDHPADDDEHIVASGEYAIAVASWIENRKVEGLRPVDADFIAASREDVPWLCERLAEMVERVGELEREKEALSAALKGHHDAPWLCELCR